MANLKHLRTTRIWRAHVTEYYVYDGNILVIIVSVHMRRILYTLLLLIFTFSRTFIVPVSTIFTSNFVNAVEKKISLQHARLCVCVFFLTYTVKPR